MLTPGHTLIHQIAEIGVELRGSSREINRVGISAVEGGEAGVHGFPTHDLAPTVRTCIDMAVAAGHVAELAKIDLEDLDSTRGEGHASLSLQSSLEVPAGGKMIERHHLETLDLTSRFCQRSTPRP